MSHLAPPQIMGGRRERRGFKCAKCQVFQLNHMDVLNTWRMRWDSNPRYAFDVYALSRRAPSTARPPILKKSPLNAFLTRFRDLLFALFRLTVQPQPA